MAFTKKPMPWPMNFRPLPNSFGVLYQSLSSEVGVGGITVAPTATTSLFVGTPVAFTYAVASAAMCGNVAAAGSGAITAQLIRDNAGTPVTLTAATSIKNDVVVTALAFDWPITATDQNRTCNPGDTLRWEIVAVGTVTTAPQLSPCVVIGIKN